MLMLTGHLSLAILVLLCPRDGPRSPCGRSDFLIGKVKVVELLLGKILLGTKLVPQLDLLSNFTTLACAQNGPWTKRWSGGRCAIGRGMDDLERAHRRLGVRFSSSDEEVRAASPDQALILHGRAEGPWCVRGEKLHACTDSAKLRGRQIKVAFRKAAFAAHPDRAQVWSSCFRAQCAAARCRRFLCLRPQSSTRAQRGGGDTAGRAEYESGTRVCCFRQVSEQASADGFKEVQQAFDAIKSYRENRSLAHRMAAAQNTTAHRDDAYKNNAARSAANAAGTYSVLKPVLFLRLGAGRDAR
jgi:hypothetical protein